MRGFLPERKPLPPVRPLLLAWFVFSVVLSWFLVAESGKVPSPGPQGRDAILESAPAWEGGPSGKSVSASEPTRSEGAPGLEPSRGAVRARLEAPYAQVFVEAARETGLDPALLAVVARVESEFKPWAVSRAGARGLMQLTPETARRYGADPHDPTQAVRAAAKYLRELIAEHGSVEAALRAYNGGPEAADRRTAPAESKEFARRVMEEWRAAYR